MKKIVALLLIALLLIGLTSCGEEKKAEKPAEKEVVKEEAKEESKEETVVEEKKEEGSKNDPNTIEMDNYKFVITEHEVIDNAMFPEKKILAVHLTFTNKSDEPKNIWMTQAFKAEQETDVTVELLNGANGQFPDDYHPELIKMGSEVDIKPGATVEAIIGYDMIDPEKPVYLRPFIGDDFEIILNK